MGTSNNCSWDQPGDLELGKQRLTLF